MTIRFTAQGARELRAVARWSVETFDAEVADAYIQALHDGVAMAEKIPGISKEVPRSKGARRILRGNHWVYFLLDEHGTLVLRVVHTRQTQPARL